MLEMTSPIPWIDLSFGMLEGWWRFDDGRGHALAHQERWGDAKPTKCHQIQYTIRFPKSNARTLEKVYLYFDHGQTYIP
ncbi:ketoacyl-synt-domain-containing protein [Apiospora saccharicola]|uniref:Ketoacyl-synt-domain-containing protein n=1 Tax=Apiospora saccharicola TaxID=335842 RepID=A0ABR1UGY9_9PEZI